MLYMNSLSRFELGIFGHEWVQYFGPNALFWVFENPQMRFLRQLLRTRLQRRRNWQNNIFAWAHTVCTENQTWLSQAPFYFDLAESGLLFFCFFCGEFAANGLLSLVE
jgi:hypothetical protein